LLQQILELFEEEIRAEDRSPGTYDNVGGDAYNQTLSEARAKAIVTGSLNMGSPATGLRQRIGKTRPIAITQPTRGSENRRVEIADPNCAAHGSSLERLAAVFQKSGFSRLVSGYEMASESSRSILSSVYGDF